MLKQSGELVQSSRALALGTNKRLADGFDPLGGKYQGRLQQRSSSIAESGGTSASISRRNWNARFLNLTSRDVSDYKRYNFSRPDAVLDLGSQSRRGRIVAQFDQDYGFGSPGRGVNNSQFAMEAWTRIRLRKGLFYKLSSDSDDGTRFMFKDRKSGQILAELNGNWRDRSQQDPAWSQVLASAQGGGIDLYMQYYERTGESSIDVRLEKFKPRAEVIATSLNVRSAPTTVNNTPIGYLNKGETFKIIRKVRSPNDTTFRDWYQIRTQDNKLAYVAADSTLVGLADGSGIVAIGDTGLEPPPWNDKPPSDGGSPAPGAGYISPRVWITSDDRISIRSTNDISGTELTRLGANASVTVLEKVTGGKYLNGFDEWYKIKFNQGGQTKEGFVAAYYVDLVDNGGKYNTAISKDNSLYKPHLNEVLSPTYYSTSYRPFIEQAASRHSWLKPSVIAGIGSRESAWGRLLSPGGPGGTGDGGHGRGLMQIDDRFHQAFISSGRWSNPKDNIDYGIDSVLAVNYNYLARNTNLKGTELLRGALASYNAGLGNVLKALNQGLDVDYYTTGQDYSADVLNRAGWYQVNGWV